ncbi:MAG: bifunctional phosphopantothenoylcysteine decarboxylase/phosphopantothenate--cysteine ligase CoaBC [Candidatus Eremiobacteraeota bacterium]|nr:bifunctional phosphopantothenoylcysteine decarboxylase/phosphopantothenate--cysteine ligase CoaBC [Candidatus Eremiobacteraeota bacterium]
MPHAHRILVGVCGGIAAYKAAGLVSTLVQRGDVVDVVMTESAQRFVAPLTFAALTGRRVHTSLWDDPETIGHISLVRAAQIFAIVPATANVIAKLAGGIADDLLTNAVLAARIPLVVAPAMNMAMYEHPATVENVRRLRERGALIVEPASGYLAEGEYGVGRLADEDAIIAQIDAVLRHGRELRGQRIVVTAGPTREAVDPVRFLSNASTGTMGIEIAREALSRGAEVDLVLGPTQLEPPHGVRVRRVTTAEQMRRAVMEVADGAAVLVATAAVADFRPAVTFAQKVKKNEGAEAIALERTPDILEELGRQKNGTFLVGFAAETERLEENARLKLRAKRLDAIAVNDVSHEERGFGVGPNELTVLYGDDGRIPLGFGGKRELARGLWDAIEQIRRG